MSAPRATAGSHKTRRKAPTDELLHTSKPVPKGTPSAGLDQQDFLPLAVKGFGDGWNAYIHGMNWFEGRLYCGTFRANLCLKRRQKERGPQFDPWPIKCPDGDEHETIDCRAQLWRFDPQTTSWKMVQQAPRVMGSHGKLIQRECAYRGIFVFQGKSDPKPVVYVTPFANTQAPGPVILRSEDGETFEPCSSPGLGLPGVSSFRACVPFKGRVFTSPVGMNNNVVNYSRYPIVYASEDPAQDVWFQASEPGFGNPDNSVIFNIASNGDFLYAGTFNHKTGFELWKTRAEGTPPYEWTKVIEFGAYRWNYNEGVLAMCSFKGALYIGTCIQDGGFDRINRIGPAAGEVIRVYPDDSWEVVVGNARLTPKGVVAPTSGLSAGFGDFFNGYIWRMCEHDGSLYIGTVNWSTYLRYINFEAWPDKLRSVIFERGIEETIAEHAGFDLWRTEDGDNFTPVTLSGFGNEYNAGLRTFTSTPYGLAVGTVNVFGPDVAVRDGEGWKHVPNPRGGAEVWLGSKDFSDALRNMHPAGAPDAPGVTAESYRLSSMTYENAPPEEIRVPLKGPKGSSRKPADLRRQMMQIDLKKVASDTLDEAAELFDLEIRGVENIPARGAALFVGNNPAVPIFVGGTFAPLHALYTLREISAVRGWPTWLLAEPRYLNAAEKGLKRPTALERLGFVPATSRNGRQLLSMGQAVLCYPEGEPSRPPYRMHDFAHAYIMMARRAEVPIVPVAFIGPHESHIIVEHDGQQIVINKSKPLSARYALRFLPPVDPMAHIPSVRSVSAAKALTRQVQRDIQIALDQEAVGRPVIDMVRNLQRRVGGNPAANEFEPDFSI